MSETVYMMKMDVPVQYGNGTVGNRPVSLSVGNYEEVLKFFLKNMDPNQRDLPSRLIKPSFYISEISKVPDLSVYNTEGWTEISSYQEMIDYLQQE